MVQNKRKSISSGARESSICFTLLMTHSCPLKMRPNDWKALQSGRTNAAARWNFRASREREDESFLHEKDSRTFKRLRNVYINHLQNLKCGLDCRERETCRRGTNCSRKVQKFLAEDSLTVNASFKGE